jgi:formate hydrogenlyase transcriptional activator
VPGGAQPPSKPPLVVFGNDDFAPLSYLDAGTPAGLDVDVAHAVAAAMGRELRIELMDWGDARERVLRGEADALIDLSVGDERSALWDFTAEIFQHEFTLFVRKTETDIRGSRNLAGRRVGAAPGGLAFEFLTAQGGVTVVPFASYAEALDLLQSGRVDAVAGDQWAFAHAAERRGMTDIAAAGSPFLTRPSGFGIRKGNAALVDEMNRAIATLRADGTLARIQDRWRPQQLVFVTQRRWQMVTGGALLALGLVAAALALWIVTLKRQIGVRRAAEEKFTRAFNASPDCIAIQDLDGQRFLEVNERFEQITGFTRQELIGRTVLQLGMITDMRQREALLEQLTRGEPIHDAEMRLRRKDGQILTALVSAEVMTLPGRRYALYVARDVTRQKQLEAHLRRASEINRLFVSELDAEALYTVVTQSLSGVVAVDYAGLVLYDASQELQVRAQTFYDGRGVQASRKAVSAGGALARVALERGDVTLFGDDELTALGDAVAPLAAEGLRTICCVPLGGRRGPLGVLKVGSRRDHAFGADDIELLRQLSTYVGIAVENAITYDEVTRLKNQLAEEKLYLEEEIRVNHNFEDIVGQSQTLRRVLQEVETVAPTESGVLILGETGTGKELLARAIHDLSPRKGRTFVRVDAAALPATLIESELFGYERGAFTGAVASRIGRFELAHHGTLFLDEVGDIPLELQAKLLRALQEREFERLGSTRTQHVDVRVIAATNRDLESMVADGTFRRDLYYRLNVFPIRVPALRERPEDIPLLVRHFVERFSARLKRHIDTIPAATMHALQQWRWPGNVRELEHVIERAVITSTGSVLQVPLAGLTSSADSPARSHVELPRLPSGGLTFADAERETILRALREAKGVVAGAEGAAARLGMKRTTLQSKMRKLGIRRPSF